MLKPWRLALKNTSAHVSHTRTCSVPGPCNATFAKLHDSHTALSLSQHKDMHKDMHTTTQVQTRAYGEQVVRTRSTSTTMHSMRSPIRTSEGRYA